MEAQNNNPQQPEVAAAPDTNLAAYCMKTKQKNVPMQEAVISRTARGGYMAQGHDGNGNKMTTMLNGERAIACVKAGTATKDDSWELPAE